MLGLIFGFGLGVPLIIGSVPAILITRINDIRLEANVPDKMELGLGAYTVDAKVIKNGKEQKIKNMVHSSSPEEAFVSTFDVEKQQVSLTPKKSGKVSLELKAILEDGSECSATYDILVAPAYITSVGIEASKNSISINESQADEITYTATVQPEEFVEQKVTWVATYDGSETLPEGVELVQTTSNTAKLKVNKPEVGTDVIKVYAKSVDKTKEGKTVDSNKIDSTINVSAYYPTSVTIEGGPSDPVPLTEGESITPITYTSKVSPEEVSQDVTWFATYNGSTTLPTGFSLDPTGKFTANANAVQGSYTFEIYAKANQTDRKGNIVKSNTKTITVVVTKPLSESVTVQATSPTKFNIAKGTAYTSQEYTATVLPAHAVQDVTWEVVDQTTGLEIPGIEFDGNVIKVANSVEDGEYKLKVRATTTDHALPAEQKQSSWYNMTINVVALLITGTDRILYTDVNTTSEKERTFQTSYNPESITGDITWHVVGKDSGTPIDGIYFEPNTSAISVDATKLTAGTYNVKVYATGTVEGISDPVKSNEIEFPVIIINPNNNGAFIQGDTSTIYISYNQIGSSRTYTSTITPYNTTPSAVTWDMHNTNGVGDLPTGITMVPNADLIHCDLKVDKSTPIGEYKIDISCAATVQGESVNSNRLTVNVVVQPQPHNLNKLVYQGTTYTLLDLFNPNQLRWQDKAAASSHTPLTVTYYTNPEAPVEERVTSTLTIPWENRNDITSVILKTCNPSNTRVYDRFLYAMYNLENVDISGLCNVTRLGLTFIGGIARVTGQDFDAGFTKLKYVDLSPLNNVLTIDGDFMYNCTGLQSIDIGSLYNIPNLGEYFLQRCIGLKEVNFSNMININIIGRRFMHCCTNLLRLDLSQAKKITTINPGFVQDCSNLTEVNLGSIASTVFSNDRSEASISNPDFNFALWTQFTNNPTTQPAYKNGILIKGTYASVIAGRFSTGDGAVDSYHWYRKTKTS